MKLMIFFILFILLLPAAGHAASLSINANIGASKVGDTMRIYVTYYDNASHTVANADCRMSGGFLGGSVSLPYNALDYYQYDLYLASAGTHTFSFSCSKSGVDTATGTATIDVPKGSSTLSLAGVPGSSDVGSKMALQIQYQSAGSKIGGAACTLDVFPPEGAKESLRMTESGSYYTAYYAPASAGAYSFTAYCSSDKYAYQSQSFVVQATKRKSVLFSSDVLSTYYPDRPIEVMYNYKAGDGSIISNAKCSYELRKKDALVGSGTIPITSSGYVLSLTGLEPDTLPYTLKASCESSEYFLESTSNSFFVNELPTFIKITKDLQKGAYSFAPLALEIKYVASDTSREIKDAACSISMPDANINTSSTTLQTALPAVDSQKTLRIEACCSKKGHKPSCASEYIAVIPQPIAMMPLSVPSELIAGDKYRIGVSASAAYYGKPDSISCRLDARITKGDAAPKSMALERKDTTHSAEVSFERAGHWDVTYTCFGKGYQQQSLDTYLRVKVFDKAHENTLMTVLGALALALSLAILIIRRRYKV